MPHVFPEVLVDLGFPHELFGESECFEDGAGVGAAVADVVDLARSGSGDKRFDKGGDLVSVDLVPDLLAAVAEDFVFASFELTLHEVTEEAVEFDAAVVGPGEASAAEVACGKSEGAKNSASGAAR